MHTGAITRRVTITAFLGLPVLYLGFCDAMDKPATLVTGEDLMIREICAESGRYVGQVVTLRGHFQGWQVAECRFPEGAANQPRTRGDWLIRTGDDCVYVTGGVPKDFDPMRPENIGRRIELEAEVMRGEDRKVYLAYRNSRRS